MAHIFPRPRVLVSRCLGFAACRYDGQRLHSAVVDLLEDHVDFVDVCPEVDAGLGVPRPPIRLCQEGDKVEVWQPAESRTVTSALQGAVDKAGSYMPACDGAILKAKSPSCGLRDAKVYRSISTPQFLRWDSGLFGAFILREFAHKAVEDEQRLSNLALREHFLIKLYLWARFRRIAEHPKIGELVAFHASHKLLLLAYNQSRFRLSGKLVANHDHLPAKDVFDRYGEELGHILAKPFQRKAMVNTLYHAFGWVSKNLSGREKEYIVNTIEEYRDERIPLQAATRLIEAQAIRFNQEYLIHQVLLQPFPALLSNLSDSGKGREVE